LLPAAARNHLRDQSPLSRRRAPGYPGDEARVARMSLIEEGGEKRVRMANLAVVGSHEVNGVAELHSKLLEEDGAPRPSPSTGRIDS
jgi:glucan phosphorylase